MSLRKALLFIGTALVVAACGYSTAPVSQDADSAAKKPKAPQPTTETQSVEECRGIVILSGKDTVCVDS